MREWFAKMRISAALDGDRRPAARSQRKSSVSNELRDFDGEMATLDGALKRTAPNPHAPPVLHGSIMRAVRAIERPEAKAQRQRAFLRWVPAPVVVVLGLMMVLNAARGPVRPPIQATHPLTDATTALRVSGEMARAVPSAVVSPLTDELQRLNQDLDNTAQFLLASLP